jgi:hypothetical protein
MSFLWIAANSFPVSVLEFRKETVFYRILLASYCFRLPDSPESITIGDEFPETRY